MSPKRSSPERLTLIPHIRESRGRPPRERSRRSSAGSSATIVTWPSLRPGRGSFPYRWRCAPGMSEMAAGSGTVPIRFTMALEPRASVEPSGSPVTARRWFSNWLVSAPSIVQWPELCTRGAISLPRSSSPIWNSSIAMHADVLQPVHDGARAATRRAPGAGASDPARARWRAEGSLRGDGSRRADSTRPSRRGRGRPGSRARGRTPRAVRGSTGTSPIARHASSASTASWITACPLPS